LGLRAYGISALQRVGEVEPEAELVFNTPRKKPEVQ
jgi:hypothetical protein